MRNILFSLLLLGCSGSPATTSETATRVILSNACAIVETRDSAELARLTGKPAESFDALRKICLAAEAADNALNNETPASMTATGVPAVLGVSGSTSE